MTSDKYFFEKLTPVDDVNLKIYKDAIDFAFQDNDIKNIAISGPFGAGKSSIIETYKKANLDKKIINISLADFHDVKRSKNFSEEIIKTNTDAQNDTNPNEKIKKLEGKILNQLIHQIDAESIPQTSFKIKHENDKMQTIVQTFCIGMLIIAIVYLLNFDAWCNFVNSHQTIYPPLSWTVAPSTIIFSVILVIVILFYFIYYFITIQNNKNLIKKISFQGNEVEIFSQSDDSFFDKYLNEVLYLFKRSGADAIVFEDLDRYESTIIFQRLREINTLINNSEDKKIKFFYLLKDDLFDTKDRTKFFDIIIPVVPIVDSSNSFDLFFDLFKKGNIMNLFNESLLRNISLYIDDMRVLKNIFNEFIIYNTQITTTQQNANKLLSIIVYKNLFPSDFSLLQINKGVVYDIIASKKAIIEEKKKSIQALISNMENEIKKIENEFAKTESEINTLYMYPPYGDGRRNTYTQYISEKEERIELVRKKQNGNIQKLQSKINQKRDELKIVEGKQISELISDENRNSIFYPEFTTNALRNDDSYELLVYLLSEGYIDETYQDYMTYFYENSISRNDKIFLRGIVEKSAKSYDYNLDNPAAVANMLRLYDYDHKEILNYQLLLHLLNKDTEKDSELQHFFTTLKNIEAVDFVINYVETNNNLNKVLYYLNICWLEFLGLILSDEKCPNELKRKFLSMYFNYSSDKTLSDINVNNVIGEYISNNTEVLYIDNIFPETFIEKIKLLNIKFNNYKFDANYFSMWHAVYINDLYEITWETIQNILEKKYMIPFSEEYHKRNLSLILSKPDEPLANYIKSNIDIYFDIMVENCSESFHDDENVIKYILGNESLNDKQKYCYIERLSAKLLYLEGVDNIEYCAALIEQNGVIFSSENIVYYFFKNNKQYDDVLIEFINSSFISFDLTKEDIDEKYGEDAGEDLFDQTIICNSICNSAYKNILDKFDYCYKSFNLHNIGSDKVNILIDLGIIRMNRDSLINMRELYQQNIYHYIISDIEKYLELVREGLFDRNELFLILGSDINANYKVELLKCTTLPVSVKEINKCDEVVIHILQNNFDVSDLQYIISEYDSFSKTVKPFVEEIICNYTELIFDNDYNLPFDLISSITKRKDVDSTLKFKLLACSLSNMNAEICKKCLSNIKCSPSKNFDSLFTGGRPKFEITDVNEKILKIFKQKGWITQFRVEEGFYRAFGKKASSRKIIPIDDFID